MDNYSTEINSVIHFHPTQSLKLSKLYISFQFQQISQQLNTRKLKISDKPNQVIKLKHVGMEKKEEARINKKTLELQ